MMVGGSTAVVLSGVLSRAMLMVSPIFMRILLLAFFGAALGAGSGLWWPSSPPASVQLVGFSDMLGEWRCLEWWVVWECGLGLLCPGVAAGAARWRVARGLRSRLVLRCRLCVACWCFGDLCARVA